MPVPPDNIEIIKGIDNGPLLGLASAVIGGARVGKARALLKTQLFKCGGATQLSAGYKENSLVHLKAR